MKATRAIIGRNWLGQYYIAIDDGQTQAMYWGSGAMEDAILSIPALLEEHPRISNYHEMQRLYDNHGSDNRAEYDALEQVIATDYPTCYED